MEHTYCAPIATAAVLLPTTLWQERLMGFQHLDFSHQSGIGRKTARGRKVVRRGRSGTSEKMVMRVIICWKSQRAHRLLTAGLVDRMYILKLL